METKLSKLLTMMAAGDWRDAISLANKFSQLGLERDAIKRAHMAFTNPTFCIQTGRDPAALIEAGKEALRRRYLKEAA